MKKEAKLTVFENQNLEQILDKPSNDNIITPNDKRLKIIIPGNLWIVDNFFTDKECDSMISLTEKLGFETATLNIGNNVQVIDTYTRNCLRCMIDDFKAGEIILKRLENVLPTVNEGGILSSVNERLRVLKYSKNNEFKTHNDGLFPRELNGVSERSVITLQIYLNDNEKGGETIFYNDNLFKDSKGEYRCQPKKGRVAIFRQYGFLHCGAKVDELKYTIRSDIMYRTLNADEKKQAKEASEGTELTSKEKCNFCGEIIKFSSSTCKDKFLLRCGCINWLEKSRPMFYCVTCDNKCKFEKD